MARADVALCSPGAGTTRKNLPRGAPPDYVNYMAGQPLIYAPGTGPARILGGERVVHIEDVADSDLYRSGDPGRCAVVDLAGARTLLLVPLTREEAIFGFIMIYR